MNPAMWICLDAEIVNGNNLHKPSMELPGSQSRNYLETTHGTTWKSCGYTCSILDKPTLYVSCSGYSRKLLVW